MLFQSPLQEMAQPLFLDILMEVYTHIQWKINPSRKYSLIILFLMVSGTEKTLWQQEMTKKLHSMILLATSCSDSTTPMMTKSRTSLSAISILLAKVLLSEISIDSTFITSTKKEDNGKKSSAKTFKTITLLLLSVGKTMAADLSLETFVAQLMFMTPVSRKRKKESSCLITSLQVKS
jgi:hypothetical protein